MGSKISKISSKSFSKALKRVIIQKIVKKKDIQTAPILVRNPTTHYYPENDSEIFPEDEFDSDFTLENENSSETLNYEGMDLTKCIEPPEIPQEYYNEEKFTIFVSHYRRLINNKNIPESRLSSWLLSYDFLILIKAYSLPTRDLILKRKKSLTFMFSNKKGDKNNLVLDYTGYCRTDLVSSRKHAIGNYKCGYWEITFDGILCYFQRFIDYQKEWEAFNNKINHKDDYEINEKKPKNNVIIKKYTFEQLKNSPKITNF